jgi:hypothetical protein
MTGLRGSCSLSQLAYSVFGTLLRGGGSSGNTDTFHRLFLIPYSRGGICGQGGGGKVTATCVWGGGVPGAEHSSTVLLLVLQSTACCPIFQS